MSSRKNPNETVPRKTMKALKEELLRWICEKQASNSQLDISALKHKAIEIAKELGSDDFKCSKSWLSSFLRKHGFSSIVNYLNPTFANYRLWIDLMRPTITQYRHKNLFHADELTMYTDVKPESVNADSKKASNNQRSCVTILLCCNSTGTEKIPLLISGTYSPPTTTNYENLYHCQDKACIDDDLFRQWIMRLNNRMASENRKILLLLHRKWTEALKDVSLDNVNLVYFPKDFPPSLRPLRRDVFHHVKMTYRRNYAVGALADLPNIEWDINQVLATLVDAWNNVPEELIVCSFQRTSFRSDDCFLQFSCDGWNSEHQGISFKKYVTFDDNLSDDRYREHSQVSKPRHDYNLRASSTDVIQLSEHQESFLDIERGHTLKRVRSRTRLYEDDTLTISDDRSIDNSQTDSDRGSRKRTHRQCEDEIVTVLPSNTAPIDSNNSVENLRAAINIKTEDDLERVRDLCGVRAVMDDLIAAVAATEDNALNRLSATKVEHEYVKRLVERIYDRNGKQTARIASVDCDNRSAVDSNLPTEGNCSKDRQRCEPSSSFKRKRPSVADDSVVEVSADGEPVEKRLKTDPQWYKHYETHYAFGSIDSSGSTSTQSVNLQFGASDLCKALTNKSKQTQIKTGDCEKRCIFTISRRSASPQLSPRN